MPKLPTIIGPFVLLAAYVALIFFIRSKLPEPDELINLIKGFYGQYGYPLIFFGALLEGAFLIGLYVPGSTVVLLGAALSAAGVLSFPLAFLLGVVGLTCGFVINYFLGKYGWYHALRKIGLEQAITNAKERLEKNGPRAILFGYFFPGSASLLSTAAGIIGMDFKKFLLWSIIAQSFWGLLWGSLAYFVGLPLVEFFIRYSSFVFTAILIIWFFKTQRKKKENP